MIRNEVTSGLLRPWNNFNGMTSHNLCVACDLRIVLIMKIQILKVTRTDLADFMLEQLTDDRWIRPAPTRSN
jgi:hypothetical protein